MRFHPYPFKWRAFRHFHALLVLILGNMRKASELDVKIAQSASEIERLEEGLDSIKNELKKEGADVKDARKKRGRANSLQRQIDQKVRSMRKNVTSFCRSIRAELKDFDRNDIDDYTLLYRGARYLRHLAEVLIMSKKVDNKVKETLKRGIREEMLSLERKAGALELQAKHLERGGINTVVFSEISPWGNRWIERRIRIRAIEINALQNRLKSDKGEDLFEDFEKEILDMYDIGRNTNILTRRLKSTFNSMRTRLKDMGISFPSIDRTQYFFEKSFKRMERMGKWLENEVKGQAHKLDLELKAA